MASSAPRYARAFAEVAESAKLDAAAAQQQMQRLRRHAGRQPRAARVPENPSIEMAQKLKVLDAIAARIGHVSAGAELHRGHPGASSPGRAGRDSGRVRELADEHAGAVEATITSARPLNDAGPCGAGSADCEAGRRAGSRELYRGSRRCWAARWFEIGSTVYDGSVRAQLQQLKQRLVNA